MESPSPNRKNRARSIKLTQAVYAAYGAGLATGEWSPMRELLHDDSLLTTFAAQQEILGPDDVIAAFQRVVHDPTYEVFNISISALADEACIVKAHVRYPLEGGGFGEGRKLWLMTYKDGLLFRSSYYDTAAMARASYVRYGVAIGVNEPIVIGES